MARTSFTPRLRARVDHYGQSHSTPGNKALHYLGIPFLAIAVFGILAKLALTFEGDTFIPMPYGGWIGILVAAVWYTYLDWKIALPTTAGLVVCFAVGNLLSVSVLGILVGIAIVVHMIGHFGFEGKAPSTLSDPMSIMDAPIWLAATWIAIYEQRRSAAPAAQASGSSSKAA